MNKEKLIRLANEHNMVGAITEVLTQRFEEDPTKLSTISAYAFMRDFVSRVEGREIGRNTVDPFWYGRMERDIKELPGIGYSSTYAHRGIFNISQDGFGGTLITEDFVYYAMSQLDMKPGHKIELAEILTQNNLNVPFDVPAIGQAQDEDKKIAIKEALLKVALAKPVAFTKIAKDEMRILGFDPKSFKKPEVMALLESIFE